MKKYTKNIFLLILICIIVLFFVLKDDFDGIVNLILNSNKKYILISMALIFISDLIKGFSLYKLVGPKFKFSFKNGLSLMLVANFFNGITPFSLGGQPFELYVLKKDSNIDYVSGANILFKDFYTYQLGFMFLTIICVFLTYSSNLLILSSLVNKLLWLGIIINVFITLFLLYIPHSKKNEFKIFKLISKLGFIKNKEGFYNKCNSWINSFKDKTKDVINDKKTVILCSLLNVIKIICVCVSTYFCFKAIGSSVQLSNVIIITVLVMVMSSFVPIPGASGGMEFSFMQLFSYYVIDSKLGASMLMWRAITYYLPMIFGCIIFLIKRKTNRK